MRTKSFIVILFFICWVINFVQGQKTNDAIDAAIKTAVDKGTMKRSGNRLIYIASQESDTARVRTYYTDLIKRSGKPYTFEFENKTEPATDRNKLVVVPPVAAANTSLASVSQAVCWSNQSVFGEVHFTDKTNEYNWTVPEGVTRIKIEAWSGGGDGYVEETYMDMTGRRLRESLLQRVSGGGGGGGAYANAVIPVVKGDRIFISIPPGGGGKSVQVKLNNSNDNSFYLNNGGDGNTDALFGKGIGGGIGGVYGLFRGKIYWLGGEDGNKAVLNNYSLEIGNNGDGALIEPRFSKITFDGDYGKGGSAALLNNGGRAGRNARPYRQNFNGENGKFPGGGGGGGNSAALELKPGKGAPGLIIIHY